MDLMQKRTKEDIARSSGLSYTTKYVLLFSALLLVTNIILGAVILRQSVSTVRKMVRQSMLNVSTTAATLVDGDVFMPPEMDARKRAEIDYGIIHPCCTYPLSNLVIEL
jgi:hypothetical protein